MSLLADLDAFYLEHRRCGEFEAGVEDTTPAAHVWIACDCGAVLVRVTTEQVESA